MSNRTTIGWFNENVRVFVHDSGFALHKDEATAKKHCLRLFPISFPQCTHAVYVQKGGFSLIVINPNNPPKSI